MPFQIVRNDITKMKVDAIVNTANPMPGYGAGTDAAVYEAAGINELLTKRHEIGFIGEGRAVITDGYKLPAKYIIHTVGTAWRGGDKGEEEVIRNCYRAVFRVAQENSVESLAIPLLASGCYGFPKEIALRIALSEIEEFMSTHELELYLVVFDEKSFLLSKEFYSDIEDYINDNYVDDRDLRLDRTPLRVTFAGRALKSADYSCSKEAMSCAAPGSAKSLDDVIKNLDKSFMEMVFSFADDRELSDVEVQRRANLDRKAFSKLKCGTTKNPSKSTALALAVALRLSLDETKDLLSRAGLALSPCSKQDVIVQYFIEREAYDIYEINIALFEHGEPTLGTQTA